MLQMSLAQLFGSFASQDGELLIIKKSQLPGLTIATQNRAQQLLVALLVKAHEQFEGSLTTPEGETINDPEGNIIGYNQSNLYQELNIFQWRTIYVRNSQYERKSIVVEKYHAD